MEVELAHMLTLILIAQNVMDQGTISIKENHAQNVYARNVEDQDGILIRTRHAKK